MSVYFVGIYPTGSSGEYFKYEQKRVRAVNTSCAGAIVSWLSGCWTKCMGTALAAKIALGDLINSKMLPLLSCRTNTE